MSRRKEDSPSIATYADHEVITPPHELRKVVGPATDPNDNPVARAEAALAELSSLFGSWMNAECDRLEAARQDLKRSGFTEKTHEALFRAAHDIKGEASTFGYPAIGSIAESLCRLVEHAPEITKIPIALVEQHVEAVRAVLREYARPDRDEVARALTKRLRDVTDEFLKNTNSFRPEYLEGIFAPPLVPGA